MQGATQAQLHQQLTPQICYPIGNRKPRETPRVTPSPESGILRSMELCAGGEVFNKILELKRFGEAEARELGGTSGSFLE